MELYRKTLRRRMRLAMLYCLLTLIPNVVLPRVFDLEYRSFTIIMGALLGVTFVVLAFIAMYGRALKDDETLKRLYIRENDERRRLIKTKMGGTGIWIVLAIVVLAVLVAGYFDRTVFVTLLAVTMLIALVMLALKLYYNRKL